MATKVKICGITNWQDAKLAASAGADMLGFNFYGPSPRFIPVSEAKRIIQRLPRTVRAVGVFVNESPAIVLDFVNLVPLDAVQLHGNESPTTVAALTNFVAVIKALRVRKGFRVQSLARYSAATAFLLDRFAPQTPGGTGQTFDWKIARRAKRYGEVILAGGLTPENVAQAIQEVRPWAIDVCSGVEAKPGKKDPARLRALMDEVEGANRGR
jgi:phosphoribosylanthranilate isomerase